MLDSLLKYAIVFLLVFIAIAVPDLYALVSGNHIDRGVTAAIGFAVACAAWFLIKPRPY